MVVFQKELANQPLYKKIIFEPPVTVTAKKMKVKNFTPLEKTLNSDLMAV